MRNIIWGTRFRRTFFGKDGIRGCFNTEIDARFVNRLGTAYGTELQEGSRVCISSNSHNAAIMLKHGLMAGMLASGLKIFDIGSTITPVPGMPFDIWVWMAGFIFDARMMIQTRFILV